MPSKKRTIASRYLSRLGSHGHNHVDDQRYISLESGQAMTHYQRVKPVIDLREFERDGVDGPETPENLNGLRFYY